MNNNGGHVVDLIISHVKKDFKNKPVLQDIELSAKRGECIGILGGNGCGKTTLLSILAGVLNADGGSFVVGGREILGQKKLCSQVIGYVPQGTPLFEELSAKDNLRLWYEKEELEKELQDGVLAMLGIPDFIKVHVNKMSGGMKKRLSIGCAVSGKRPILLLDEPTAALDLVCKQKIWDYLDSFKSQGGIVLLVTHDVQEIERCDRCYLMKEGKLVPYTYEGNVRGLVELLK